MKTLKSILIRMGQVALVLLGATFLVSVLVRQLPGDIAYMINPTASAAERASIRNELGLDRNYFVSYWMWLSQILRGDFGFFIFGGKVLPVIKSAVPPTLQLIFYTQIVALAVAIPLGITSAYKQGTRFDRFISTTLFSLVSIPNFGIGLILSVLVGVKLGIVPPSGYGRISDGLLQHFKFMLLPVMTLAIAPISSYTRLLRSEMISTMREDYVTLAKSKGISNVRILFRHVLRPSSITLMTSAALSMGGLIGGALVIEIIYVIPGMGTQLAKAIATREFLAIQSYVVIVAAFYLVFNSTVDILITFVDPRTRNRHA